MKTLETYEIDFRGSMWESRPSMLWQQLFDFYRYSGCDLENLSNLLIDFRNCQELFDKGLLYPKEKTTIHFIFGCSTGSYMTTWLNRERWIFDSVKHTMTYSCYDKHLVCSVNADRAKLIPMIEEESNHDCKAL